MTIEEFDRTPWKQGKRIIVSILGAKFKLEIIRVDFEKRTVTVRIRPFMTKVIELDKIVLL